MLQFRFEKFDIYQKFQRDIHENCDATEETSVKKSMIISHFNYSILNQVFLGYQREEPELVSPMQ